MDYFKAAGGVKYTVTPELRGGSNNGGFLAFPSDIQLSYDEIWNGLTAHVGAISSAAAASRDNSASSLGKNLALPAAAADSNVVSVSTIVVVVAVRIFSRGRV